MATDIAGGSPRRDLSGRVDASTRIMLARQQRMVVEGQNATMLTMLNTERAARVYADMQEGLARVDGDKALGARIDAEITARQTADTALGSRIDGLGTSTAAAINNEASLRSQADTAEAQARQAADTAEAKARADADALRPTVFIPGGQIAGAKIFMASGTVQNGQISFNLAPAGFASVLTVQPSVNDATTLYTFGWALSADLKTLVLSSRKSATPLLSLLGLNILAAPAAAPNGTVVQLMVMGL